LYAQVESLDWKLHVVDSEMQNACVLPNGHIFVFTGILPSVPPARCELAVSWSRAPSLLIRRLTLRISLQVPSEHALGFLLGHECAPSPYEEGAAHDVMSRLRALIPSPRVRRRCAHAILRHAGEDLATAPFVELLGLLAATALPY
jgi:hypothetical protein